MLISGKDEQTGQLEEGLFGCFGDCGSCMLSFCCPPVASAKAWAMARDEDCTLCHACLWPSAVWTRENIRRARGMEGTAVCASAMSYFCCPCCFTAQNIREIKLIKGEKERSESP